MESWQSTQPQPIGHFTRQPFDPHTQPVTQAPQEGRNGTFIRNFGKFEREGSTFHWKIFRPNREKLLGYSKPKDMAEKANKQELLQDCVRRLVKNGYIKEGMRIEFYRAYHETDDDQSVKLFTMFGTRYIPESVVLREEWLIAFLKNIYSPPVHYYNRDSPLFPTGGKSEPPTGSALIPDPAQQGKSLGAFDLGRSFKSSETLLIYCEKLQRDGHPQGRIDEFYRIKIQAFHSPNH